MRMSKLAILITIIFLSLIVISYADSPNFIISKEDQNKLSKLPGAIELILYQYPTTWLYSMKKGDLMLKSVETLPSTYLTARLRIGYGDDVPMKLPKISDYIYFGPYSISPDKSHIVVSLSSVDDKLYATDFALIRQSSKEVVFQTKNKNVQVVVDDIAWSTDSTKFVVLDHSSERKHWPIDIFSAMFGVYRDHQTYFLSIYDINGNLIVRSKIISGLINGTGQILWKDI